LAVLIPVVKWAALPLYRSVRLRIASAAKPASEPEADSTKAAAATTA
jgi:hypothetical protein